MSIDVTCACGKTTRVQDSDAGRKGKCRACGASVQVPDLGAPLSRRYVSPAPPPPPVAVAVAPPVSPAPKVSIPGLPWYFGFCRFCSGFMILAACLWLLAAILYAVNEEAERLSLTTFAAAAAPALGMVFSGGFALAVLDGMAALVRRP